MDSLSGGCSCGAVDRPQQTVWCKQMVLIVHHVHRGPWCGKQSKMLSNGKQRNRVVLFLTVKHYKPLCLPLETDWKCWHWTFFGLGLMFYHVLIWSPCASSKHLEDFHWVLATATFALGICGVQTCSGDGWFTFYLWSEFGLSKPVPIAWPRRSVTILKRDHDGLAFLSARLIGNIICVK